MDTTNSQSRAEHPILFNEFFASGKEEHISPFLIPSSRSWGKNLSLKASILAAIFLVLSYILKFTIYSSPLYHISLMFVYFLAGTPALINSIQDICDMEVNIDVLMTLAAFSSVLIGSPLEGGLLLVLFSLSGSMEDTVTSKAKGALSSLNRLSPTKACVFGEDGALLERAVIDITVGTRVLVKVGEVIPLDGKVVQGTSSVNLVHLTGESLPVPKKVEDEVPAGGYNVEGALVLEVTHTSADSTLSRIIQLITQAQEARPKLQRWLEKFTKGYSTSIIALSAIFALVLPLLQPIHYLGVNGAIYRALAFLIAASPCALIIAIPIAYLSAVGVCARRGIVLKGGVILDALAKCQAIAFDKTGTLTTGELVCLGIEGLDPTVQVDQKEALAVAAALERNMVHPIATAIVSYAQQMNVQPVELTQFKSLPGYGLEGIVDGDVGPVYIGHPEYIMPRLQSSARNLLKNRLEVLHAEGKLLGVLLIRDQVMLLCFRDTVRANLGRMLGALQNKHHMDLVMLSGDHEASAQAIGKELGIKEVYGNLRPEAKVEHVTRLSQERHLAMVGDGINDAPALARATVGISMGRVGSATAIDVSDIVLLHDNLDILDWLVGKARDVQTIVKQNVALAAVVIIFASVSALLGFIPLWLAVVLHEGGTVIVGMNSLRLLKK